MHAMTDDQIRSAAPSVFATQPGPRTSDRYAYLPTYRVVRDMRNLGFVPVSVKEGKKRQPDGRQYAMHEIRFQRSDHMQAVAEAGLGGLIPQTLLRNSHDTTTPVSVEAGSLRVACLNGMCHPGEEFGGFRIRHVGDESKRQDEFQKGMTIILEKLNRVVEVAGVWRKLTLSPTLIDKFSKAALLARGTALDIGPEWVQHVRRPEDEGNNLWAVYNRAQENLSKGGMPGRATTGRRSTLKSISTLAVDVDFNRKLWTLASELANEVRPVSVPVFA